MIKIKFLLTGFCLLLISTANAQQCPMRVNIAVQLDNSVSPSIPVLSNTAQNRVCIRSGGVVMFHRTGKGANKGFGIFLKDGSWSASTESNRLEYTAPRVTSEIEHAYGISMPYADVDLDPVIVIIP